MQIGNISCKKIQVSQFGGPEQLQFKQINLSPPPKGKVRVKVLAVSVGSTDLMARSGKYLLQPFTPLTPGYDCVGEIIDWHKSADTDLAKANQGKGTRVAICLSRMGTYTTHLCIKPWQMITLPDNLEPIRAAAIPLDYLTADSLVNTHARVKSGQKILIHGGSGAVGSIVIRLAVKLGAKVYATGSLRNKWFIESLGAYFLDYSEADLQNKILAIEPDGLDAVLLHYSGMLLHQARRITKRDGIVVNFAFNLDKAGREKFNTLSGALSIKLRQLIPLIHPHSAICSVPAEISKDHAWYRKTLEEALEFVSSEYIRIDEKHIYPLNKASEAHQIIENCENNGKLILTCT